MLDFKCSLLTPYGIFMLIKQGHLRFTFSVNGFCICFSHIENVDGWVRFFANDILVGYIEVEDFPLGDYYEKTLQDEKA